MTAPTTSAAPSRGSSSTSAAAGTGTVWLCRPGLRNNPCASDLTTTAIAADGTRTVEPAPKASDPKIDCFYVYPTVSAQKTVNANLRIDPEETAVAIAQAARFSSVCRVYAPMYPQLTSAAIAGNPSASRSQAALIAYLGVVRAWQDYLAHDNHGRGVVVIGHSQGAFLLTALLKATVDPVPAVRKRLVSALLLGGNVTVPKGKLVGGSFAHLPACTARTQTGCVVAYSSFAERPPANSYFGRAGTGIGGAAGLSGKAGDQVLCTDPAVLDGSHGRLSAYFPTSQLAAATKLPAGIATPWVSVPGQYRSSCRTVDGASWLQVSPVHTDDSRPLVRGQLGPRWGLHTVDVNIALGNLVDLVAAQAAAYLS